MRTACALLLLLSTGVARAADLTPPVSRSEIDAALLHYYGGERTAAYTILGLGAASAGAGAYLLTRSGDFEKGLAWPLLTLGGLETLGGIGYAVQVNREIDHYRDRLASDPKAFRDEEIAHIEGTASRFPLYRGFELGLAVAGAGLLAYGLAGHHDTYQGIGSGLMIVGVPFFVIDTLNNNRAHWYLDKLGRFDPSLSMAFSEHGGAIALSGQF